MEEGGKDDAGALLSHVNEVLEVLGGIAVDHRVAAVLVGAVRARGSGGHRQCWLNIAVRFIGREVSLIGVALGLSALNAGALSGVALSSFDKDAEGYG